MESTFSCCAYCWKNETLWEELLCFKCDGCGKRVHYGCIRSSQPSPLLDDTFYSFKCEACGENGKEEFSRSSISWLNVVMLTLYNLQKLGQGKCGYFHWKGHICAFIDQHWITFFGHQRKKTTLWMGTVAGTLSTGCPQYFLSGSKVVEQGFWRLTTLEAPKPGTETKKQSQRRRTTANESIVDLYPGERRCRRAGENALAAAIELKEKRSSVADHKEMRKQKQHKLDQDFTTLRDTCDAGTANLTKSMSRRGGPSKSKKKSGKSQASAIKEQWAPEATDESDSQTSIASSNHSSFTNSSQSSFVRNPLQEYDTPKGDELLTVIKMETEDDDDNLDIDIDMSVALSHNLPDPRPPSPDLQTMFNSDIEHSTMLVAGKSPVAKASASSVEVKQEQDDTESEGPSEGNLNDDLDSDDGVDNEEDTEESETDDEEEAAGGADETKESVTGIIKEYHENSWQVKKLAGKKKKKRPHKSRQPEDAPIPRSPPRLKRISVFEEGELLQNLNKAAALQTLRPELAQLRRKLICNQTNREYGLPVFDLEIQMTKFAQLEHFTSRTGSETPHPSVYPKLPNKVSRTKETRDLDRFMMQGNTKQAQSRTYTSFQQRLVGLEDHELTPVISPYTTRVLLPFIWRNYNMSKKPLKLKLLQEIQAYPHRNDPSWIPAPHPPIDYCYVRPEHIPSVNALCREFFWPGIDMSECLQYPDFSCVVLYRKIVIGFAFMVPDRGYNEAYISFIFTHPEWRGAGIATFMLYHLIQTCMGKDVLLHVSANNPAMLLYQKFGFKPEELSLNFYYTYFPLNCKDSLHAFLMRLSR